MLQVKKYPNDKSYHDTFYELMTFLNQINNDYRCLHMHWSRLEWLFARDNVKEEELSLNILFYENEELVGAILYEDEPGVYFLVYQDDSELKHKMIDYLMHETDYHDIIIPNDQEMIDLLAKHLFKKIDWVDPISVFTLDTFEIPKIEGYAIKSLDQDYRLDQIHHALWYGFDHGDPITYDNQSIEERRHMTSSPHFEKKYTYVAIKDQHYVSYAGIWYLKGSKTALIEPVATVPNHRKKGLMKACIYHAIEAVRKDGNPMIFVGSNQEAYKRIGFKPYSEGLRFKKL